MKFRCIPAALLACLLLVSCSSGTSEVTYADDVAVSQLSEAVDQAVAMDSLIAMDENYLKNAMQLDPSQFADYTVKLNGMGITIDEYGIFQAKDADSVAEVTQLAEDYLQFRLDNWMSEYLPEEFPKLEEAQVETYGTYVVYTIMSEETAQLAFDAVADVLLEG